MVEIYARSAGFPVSMEEVRWFRAFAGYRFGVITVFQPDASSARQARRSALGRYRAVGADYVLARPRAVGVVKLLLD